MKRRILNGIIVVIVVIGIAWAISALIPFSLAIPIFLAWIVWKKKTQIFHDQMDPKSAERRLKILKASLLVAAISFVGGIAGVITHNALYAATEMEDAASFIIALAAIWLFVIATGSGLAIFLKGRQKQTQRNTEISTT